MNEELTKELQKLKSLCRIRAKFIKANGQTRIIYAELPEDHEGIDNHGNLLVIELCTGYFRTIKVNRLLKLEVS